MFGEDLALEVGDDDLVAGLVAVADDEDLLEGVADIDLVEHLVDVDGSGFGRGGSASGVASQAVSGVIRPGSPWWGRWVL